METEHLRARARAVFLACEEPVAKDISKMLNDAASEIDRLRAQKEPVAEVTLDCRVIKQTFKEEKDKFLKEAQRLCAEGNHDVGKVIEERLVGIRAIESKLIEKGIAL